MANTDIPKSCIICYIEILSLHIVKGNDLTPCRYGGVFKNTIIVWLRNRNMHDYLLNFRPTVELVLTGC